MTPLEAQRMKYKDHTYEKEMSITGFRRQGSLLGMKAAASCRLTGGDHVDDAMRRESSFHKQRAETIAKLLSM